MREPLSEKIEILNLLKASTYLGLFAALMIEKPRYALPLGVLMLASDFLLRKAYATWIRKLKTERTNLDMQLIQSQKLAALGELSAGIAHEINNPLAIMSQEIEWMLHLIDTDRPLGTEETGEIKDGIRQLKVQIDRCKEVTHRLLTLARKTELIPQITDINEIVEEMAMLVEKEARSRRISVQRFLDRSIPQIMTDPPLVRQVLLNLLNNALYAIGQDGRIVLRTGVEGGSVVISVEDNGPGIPPELLGKIFDPFFTTKGPGRGTGLGLSISQGIVTRLGGRMEVKSQVALGTTFKVYLPMEAGDAKGKGAHSR
jgi:two-component system NtrC family sensor kinase